MQSYFNRFVFLTVILDGYIDSPIAVFYTSDAVKYIIRQQDELGIFELWNFTILKQL